MQLNAASLLFVAVFVGSLLASMGLVTAAIARRLQGSPLIRFEPRQPVPWGPIGLFVCSMLIGLQLSALLLGEEAAAGELDGDEFVTAVITNLAVLAIILVLGWLWVRTVHHATATDLGFVPAMLGRDLLLGLLGFGVAIAPVYAVQLMLVMVFGWQPSHDIFEALQNSSSPNVIAAAIVAALIAAPLFEEVYFRLFLQGWLERLELEFCRRPGPQPGERESAEGGHNCDDDGGGATDPAGASADPAVRDPSPASTDSWRSGYVPDGQTPVELESRDELEFNPFIPPANVDRDDPAAAETGAGADLPRRGILGLPFGWFPILVSSGMFALAHLGQGPSPIPLFLLALILGYIYQRTHRIVPCIAMHLAFNSYSLILLWLQGGVAAG